MKQIIVVDSRNKDNRAINEYFRKRTFTFQNFVKTLADLIRNSRSILKTLLSKSISAGFMERIMLSVTAVNQCRYCTYLHTRNAFKHGTSLEDIKNIFAFNFENLKEEEVGAFIFAHHYAECDCNPSDDACKDLVRCYGSKKAKDVLNIIRMITIGNLFGNTVDSFRSRLRGIPPQDGSFFFEFLVYTVGFFFHKVVEQVGIGAKI